MDSTLATALALASAYPCFFCAYDKAPTCPHGFKDASRDPAVLQVLWTNYPGPLIGVPTGAVSGIDVLDIDAKHPEARGWWAANRTRLPLTRVHRTRSGGLHLLFRHAGGVNCSAGRIVRGIDVRGVGGFIVWWPAAGFPVLRDAPIAPWPEDLVCRLRSKPPSPQPPRPVVPDDRRIRKILACLEAATEGERNNLTHWAACRFAEMLGFQLGYEEAHALIVAAAMRAGLSYHEASATAHSGLRGRT